MGSLTSLCPAATAAPQECVSRSRFRLIDFLPCPPLCIKYAMLFGPPELARPWQSGQARNFKATKRCSFTSSAHPASQLLHDPVVRDILTDHVPACYGGSVGKSMKVVELSASLRLLT
jgi:hypothetical protein